MCTPKQCSLVLFTFYLNMNIIIQYSLVHGFFGPAVCLSHSSMLLHVVIVNLFSLISNLLFVYFRAITGKVAVNILVRLIHMYIHFCTVYRTELLAHRICLYLALIVHLQIVGVPFYTPTSSV